jgi:hypothetical protein
VCLCASFLAQTKKESPTVPRIVRRPLSTQSVPPIVRGAGCDVGRLGQLLVDGVAAGAFSGTEVPGLIAAGELVPTDIVIGPHPLGGGEAPFAFSYESPFCTGLLCGRAGRLTARNSGFRPLVPLLVWSTI